ncbi:hypothetical protein ACFL2Q_08310 [Thermodesulfobacteriota bacterium]
MMARFQGTLKYVSYVALLLMVFPLMGGWKFCPKKAGIVLAMAGSQSTLTPAEDSSLRGREVSVGDGPRCACKKGKSCPSIPRVIVTSGRSLSRVEQSPEKSSTQFSCLARVS